MSVAAAVSSASARAIPPPQASGTRATRIAIAGGGTGGHIVPGLHVLAHALGAGRAGEIEDLLWLTSGRAVEERVFAGAELGDLGTRLDRVALPLEPEHGGAPSRAALVLRTPRAVWRARAALSAHRSEVLLGLGGFTTLPAVLAARALGLPVVLLEINAVRGAATAKLARFAERVLHAWRATLPDGRESARDRWIGPPLAPAIAEGDASEASARRARRALGYRAESPLLLVLGGSQGSSALNAFVRARASTLLASGVQILHQTGPGKLAEAAPAAAGYRASEYVAPMSEALAAASVCVCRGGASTLAEVAAARVPAFVAPYPHHADRHQEKNAAQLGLGARLVADERLDGALCEEIVRLSTDAGRDDRERMRAALAAAVPRDAARRVLDALVEVAAARRASSPAHSVR